MRTLSVIVLVVAMLPWSVLLLNRGQAAILDIWLYECFKGPVKVVDTPFEDIAGTPYEKAVAKLYGLGITSGTSSTTYSPLDRLELYQALIFAGKTLMRMK